jgi:hypothetical protein
LLSLCFLFRQTSEFWVCEHKWRMLPQFVPFPR